MRRRLLVILEIDETLEADPQPLAEYLEKLCKDFMTDEGERPEVESITVIEQELK